MINVTELTKSYGKHQVLKGIATSLAQGEVVAVIRDLASSGMTMMIVTHEMKFAQEAADSIYFMDDGRLVEKTAPDQFFNRPQSERAARFLEQVL